MITINHYLNQRDLHVSRKISLQSTMPQNKHPREVPWMPGLDNQNQIYIDFFILSLKCMFNFIDYETFRLETVV